MSRVGTFPERFLGMNGAKISSSILMIILIILNHIIIDKNNKNNNNDDNMRKKKVTPGWKSILHATMAMRAKEATPAQVGEYWEQHGTAPIDGFGSGHAARSRAKVEAVVMKTKRELRVNTLREPAVATSTPHVGRTERSLSTLGRQLFAPGLAQKGTKVEIGDYIMVRVQNRNARTHAEPVWRMCRVLDFRDAEHAHVQVQYEGEPPLPEEWLPFQSDRLAPFAAQMSPARRSLQVGSRRLSLADFVDAKCQMPGENAPWKWRPAQITTIEIDGSIVVNFADDASPASASILPEFLEERLLPLGTKTVASPPPSKKQAQRDVELSGALAAQGLCLEKMSADGNCLFRAVAHQIYGSADRHMELRERVCEYLLSEGQRDHFANFVDGKFEDYVRKMKRSGTWGGNLEIEAMQEIFDRKIEVHRAPVETGSEMDAQSTKTNSKTDFSSGEVVATPRPEGADAPEPIQ
eukprot:g1616.t1